jgi:hypothetical protein
VYSVSIYNMDHQPIVKGYGVGRLNHPFATRTDKPDVRRDPYARGGPLDVVTAKRSRFKGGYSFDDISGRPSPLGPHQFLPVYGEGEMTSTKAGTQEAQWHNPNGGGGILKHAPGVDHGHGHIGSQADHLEHNNGLSDIVFYVADQANASPANQHTPVFIAASGHHLLSSNALENDESGMPPELAERFAEALQAETDEMDASLIPSTSGTPLNLEETTFATPLASGTNNLNTAQEVIDEEAAVERSEVGYLDKLSPAGKAVYMALKANPEASVKEIREGISIQRKLLRMHKNLQ